jgi:putative FmdB family regulatory protein
VPKYDYRCTACGSVYEKREGFDAPSVQECPSCQGQARRVFSPPAIVFKGSGWYKTDSRGSDSSPSTSTTTETKTDTPIAASSETKTESKPAVAASDAAAAD